MMTRTAVSIGLALVLSGCGNSDAPATATAPAPGAPAKAPGAAPAPGAPPPAKAPAAPPAPAPPPAKRPAAGPPASPSLPPPAPPRAASAPTPKELDRSERPLPPTSYDARGRRDPFQHVEVPKPPRPAAVSATRLTGIVRNESGALALVEGADGIGYVLRPGDTLLDGRLVEIGADSVVFTVLGRAGPPERVTLRLPSSD